MSEQEKRAVRELEEILLAMLDKDAFPTIEEIRGGIRYALEMLYRIALSQANHTITSAGLLATGRTYHPPHTD